MRELKSLDLHSKDPFPLPESGRGKANQINILTNSCQMVKFFFCILIKLFPSPEISEDSIGLDPNPMEHLTFTNIGEMNNNNTRSLPHRG